MDQGAQRRIHRTTAKGLMLQRAVNFLAKKSSLPAGYFLLLGQKKVTKEKATLLTAPIRSSELSRVLSETRREQKISTPHIVICEEIFFVSNAVSRRNRNKSELRTGCPALLAIPSGCATRAARSDSARRLPSAWLRYSAAHKGTPNSALLSDVVVNFLKKSE